MRRGTGDFASYYGLLFAGMEAAYVNGFAYSFMRPVAEEEIPQRLQRAEEVFQHKLWREQLREWDEVSKPSAIARDRELQAVDPDAIPDQELVAYLTRCRDHHAVMMAQHMRYTEADLLPTGDFLVHAGDRTGLARGRTSWRARRPSRPSAAGSAPRTRSWAPRAGAPSGKGGGRKTTT